MSDDNPFADFDPQNDPVKQHDSVQKLNRFGGRFLLTQLAKELLKAAYPQHAKVITKLDFDSIQKDHWAYPMRKKINDIIEVSYDSADRHTGGHGLTIAMWINAKRNELSKVLGP